MAQCGCWPHHRTIITTPSSPRRHHRAIITTPSSPRRHHRAIITAPSSPRRHHCTVITVPSSPRRHHLAVITGPSSPHSHHCAIITTPSLLHHHHRVITTSSSPRHPAVRSLIRGLGEVAIKPTNKDGSCSLMANCFCVLLVFYCQRNTSSRYIALIHASGRLYQEFPRHVPNTLRC